MREHVALYPPRNGIQTKHADAVKQPIRCILAYIVALACGSCALQPFLLAACDNQKAIKL